MNPKSHTPIIACGPLRYTRMSVNLEKSAKRLLETLKDLCFAYDHQHDRGCKEKDSCIWKDAEAAIAKAEGRDL